MRLVMRQAPEWQEKAWSQVFSAVVEGVKAPPEEPCHKCVRIYGILASEFSTALDSVNDSSANVGYAAADALNAADTVRLLAKLECIPEGFIADVDEAVHKIREDEHAVAQEEYDKEDVEEAVNQMINFSDRILEAVVAKCKGLGT